VSLVDGNKRFYEFAPAIRTLSASVRDLEVHRGWDADPLFSILGEEEESSGRDWITGTALLGKDRIAVIGSEREAVRELSFSLRSFPSVEQHAARWQKQRSTWGDPLSKFESDSLDEDGKRVLQYLRNVFTHFDDRPPTLWLGFTSADWELGWSDNWSMECDVPETVFNELSADILNGHCRSLDVSLSLQPTLSNSAYAPPSVPVCLGVLASPGQSDARSNGWLQGLTWIRTPVSSQAPGLATAI